MSKWFIGALIFILTYLFFMLSQVPAKWVVNQISLPKNIVLQGVDGTIWQGSINRITIDGYIINNAKTNVSLLSLITFNPSVDTTFGSALVNGPEGKATLSDLLGNIEVRDAQVSIAANDITQLLRSALPIPITAQQFVDVNIDEFVMGKPLCEQLNGTVKWQKAGIKALDQKIAFGNLKGKLECEKGLVKFSFDPENNLGLTFTALVYSPKRISGSGYIEPGSKFPTLLKEALPYIGKADSRGRYKLNF
jgi:general secretion pathway protein N